MGEFMIIAGYIMMGYCVGKILYRKMKANKGVN